MAPGKQRARALEYPLHSKKRKRESESGDALSEADYDDGRKLAREASGKGGSLGNCSEGKRRKAEKMAQRHAALKQKRKENYERDRLAADMRLVKQPAAFLWEAYCKWAEERLLKLGTENRKWSEDSVVSVAADSDMLLIDKVKEVVGRDYVERGAWKKGSLPGVACLALCPSALNAVSVAKSLYDGKPVGKLFTKHLALKEQRKWLAKNSKRSLVVSAVGTPKRVHDLCKENSLSLEYTTALVIDFGRNAKLQNILDMNEPRKQLFELIHDYVRPQLLNGELKIVLYVPTTSGAGSMDGNSKEKEPEDE